MVALPVVVATLLEGSVPLPAAALLPSPLLLPRDGLLACALRLLLLLRLLRPLLRLLLLSLLDPLLLLRLLLLSLLDPPLLLLSLLDPLLLLRALLLSLLNLLLLLRPRLLGLLDPLLLLRTHLLSLLNPLLRLRLRLLSLLGPLLLRLLVSRFGPLRLSMLLLGRRPRCLLLPFRLCLSLLIFVLRIRRHHCPKKQKQGGGTCSSSELHSLLPFVRSLLGVHAGGQSAPLRLQRLCCPGFGPGLVHHSIRVIGRKVDRIQPQRRQETGRRPGHLVADLFPRSDALSHGSGLYLLVS
jgi:hypothetical protein